MARAAASGRVAGTRTNSILYNGNFASAPSVLTAQTNVAGRWIDGTAAGSSAAKGLGWAVATSGIVASAGASFDNTVSHSGTYSIKLSTLDATGTIVVSNLRPAASAVAMNQIYRLSAATAYTLQFYVKTNNVATNSAFIDFREYNSAGTAVATTSSAKKTGTIDWTLVSLTVTTNASTVFGALLLRNGVAGNISDTWFADMTLKPVNIGRVAGSGRVAP